MIEFSMGLYTFIIGAVTGFYSIYINHELLMILAIILIFLSGIFMNQERILKKVED